MRNGSLSDTLLKSKGAVKKLPQKKIAEVVRLQRFFGIIMLCY